MGSDISEEQRAIDRAISGARAILEGKQGLLLTPHERQWVETFPPVDQVPVIVFTRWCQGKKWKEGIQAKVAAKAAFISAFRIARAIYEPEAANKKPESGIILPS